MTTLMRFDSGTDSLEFEAGADYPASRPIEIFQVQDRTAAGILQVESLGVSVSRRVLTFTLMSLVDYQALLNWFINIVNGGEKDFSFTDEKGVIGLVKITDNILNFVETDFEIFSGVLNLEYV